MGLKDRLRNLEKKLSGESSEIIFVECDADYNKLAQESENLRNFAIHHEGEILTFTEFEDVERYIEKLKEQTNKNYRTILICKVYPEGSENDVP